MQKVLLVLLGGVAGSGRIGLFREKKDGVIGAFEYEEEVYIYDIARDRIIEKFPREGVIVKRGGSSEKEIQEIGNGSLDSVRETGSNIQKSEVENTGIESIQPVGENIKSITEDRKRRIKSIDSLSRVGIDRRKNSLLEIYSGIKEKNILSGVVLIEGAVISQESRVGIEYKISQIGRIVFVYNEDVTRIFRPEEVIEKIERKITSIISKTLVNRKNIHYKTFMDLRNKYSVNTYILKEIDGFFYFSEVVLNEISEENLKVLNRLIGYSLYVSVLTLFLFLLGPVIIRVIGSKDRSIKILPGKSRLFKKGVLFGKKPVYVLVLRKSLEAEDILIRNIELLKENEVQDGTVYLESNKEYFYAVYSTSIHSIRSLLQEAEITYETKKEVGFFIVKYLERMHRKGFMNFMFTTENILVDIHTKEILFLGLNRMISSKDKEKQTDRLEVAKESDYLSLGEIYYALYNDKINTIHIFRNKSFIDAYSYIDRYNYKNNPKFIIGVETKEQVEVLDWISYLISQEPYNNRKSIKPIGNIHPVFWSTTQSLEFICLFSDFVFDHPELSVLETSKISHSLIRDMTNWDAYIDKSLLDHLTRNGKYYYNTKHIRDLLRLIRNNGRHFQSIPEDGRRHFNNEIATYTTYFLSKFPYLVLFLYYTAEEHCITTDSKIFKEIFSMKNS